MLSTAPRSGEQGEADQPNAKEGSPVNDGQQRIVDQAKARGNARDTGVVPDHHPMGLNSTTAEEVKVTDSDKDDS
jgi:hypothetical protein